MADDAAAPDGEQSEDPSGTEGTEAEAAEPDVATADESVDGDAAGEPTRAKTRMSHVRLATIIGLVAVVALAALCGWLGFRAYQSHKVADERNQFLQAARQGAVNLTTFDVDHIDDDVRRVLDSSTGNFYDEFQARAQPFSEVVKQVKAKSAGTVVESGLKSQSDNTADVLVALRVTSSNAGVAQVEPRAFRMVITVEKVGGDIKVSNMRYV